MSSSTWPPGCRTLPAKTSVSARHAARTRTAAGPASAPWSVNTRSARWAPAPRRSSRPRKRATSPGCAQAAQAGVRSRPGALPELQRQADDHRRDPGPRQGLCALAAGGRKDPHAPGSAGQSAATGAPPWIAAANGLTSPSQHASGGPAPRAAGRGSAAPALRRTEVRRPVAGEARRRPPRVTLFGVAIDPQQAATEPKDRISGCSRALPTGFGTEKCVRVSCPLALFMTWPPVSN